MARGVGARLTILTRFSDELSVPLSVRILVAAGDPTTRMFIEGILSNLGFAQVTFVDNGQRAWSEIVNGEPGKKFDLVVCDWEVPELSGIELLRKIRAYGPTHLLPFTLLTWQKTRQQVVEAISAGVTNYIAKPFTPETFATKVNEALSPATVLKIAVKGQR